MARLTHLKPGADQGISADWESVEHEWSILAMVPSNNRLPGPVPSRDRAPETVEGPHHAILNFAISASQLEEVVPDCRGSRSGLWLGGKRGILRDQFDRVLRPSGHPQSEK